QKSDILRASLQAFGPIEQMSKDHRPKSLLPLSDRWPAWAEYALALGIVIAAIGARSLLTPLLGDRVPFITLFLVMMPLLLLVRPGAFLLAALLGLILTWYIILFPEYAFRLNDPGE